MFVTFPREQRVAEAASWVRQGWRKLAFPRVLRREEGGCVVSMDTSLLHFPSGGDKCDWI